MSKLTNIVELAVRLDEQSSPYGGRTALPRYSRRLSDKILIAAHRSFDQGDIENARRLLQLAETILRREPASQDRGRLRSMERLVAAYERMWQLRHPDPSLAARHVPKDLPLQAKL